MPAAAPTLRLVRPPRPAAEPVLDAAQQAVVEHVRGPLRVLAGPGTGKTTALVSAAARRITEGARPESVLFLTFGRRGATRMRDRISALVGRTLREPLARTFHSYAYGVLVRMAQARGWERPRLLSGPEQDMIIRELLAGDLADDLADELAVELRDDADGSAVGFRWPPRLRDALRTRGFAGELRDLLMRCAERGISADRLRTWGERAGRDDWVAAARFMTQYAGVTGFHEGGAYDPAEVIRAALDGLREDPDLLDRECDRLRWVYVDEYQDVDPAQAELLALVTARAEALVVAGDPDQSVYAFRGSAATELRDFPVDFHAPDGKPAPTIVLPTSRRSAPGLVEAQARINVRLAGPHTQRATRAAPEASGGRVEAHLLRSPAQEAAYVAHRLREAHLADGVDWSRMAVLVRSTARSLPALRRAFHAAGVPLAVAGDELPLMAQPAVTALLEILRVATRPDTLDEMTALELVGSPYVGADPLALRRARQELRRVELAGAALDRPGARRSSATLLRDALADPRELTAADPDAVAPVARAGALITAARTAAESGASAEDVLWAVWSSADVAERWQRTSLSGGARGAAADADLDAVVAAFDAAARFADRLPGAGPAQFLDHVRGQEIPGDPVASRAPAGEAVTVLTAHAAKGLEWDVVVVPGVQEGLWPDLRPRGSVLGSEALVDLAAGRDPGVVSRTAQMLDEERRLFYVAATRARRHVVVTAVESADLEPSRFLDELVPHDADSQRPFTRFARSLTLGDVTAELRSAAVSATVAEPVRRGAIEHLAQLARDGVPGAAPGEWYGLLPLSDDSPLRPPGRSVSVSPSRVEQFEQCALRWMLETSGGTNGTGAPQGLGTLVHEAAALADRESGVSEAELEARIDAGWAALDLGGPWYAAKERERVRRMIRRLLDWMASNPRELVAVEEGFEFTVGRAVVRGRVDRLERDAEDRLVPVDVKTTKNPPPKGEAAENPQLGVYQLAVAAGAFEPVAGPAEVGGAELLHLGKDSAQGAATVAAQPALSAAERPEWARDLVLRVAEGMAGSAFDAVANSRCVHCPVRTSCPVQREGRQVTQ